MKLKLPISIALSSILALTPLLSATAQQKRQTPAKPPATPVAKPTPVTTPPQPTFDTLLAANSYKIYAEIRSVGQLIRSNTINEILEPIMKLASPPKEFRTVIKWLNTHADDVTSSRLLLASWPAPGTEVPANVVAIEFASAEEAAKFDVKLNEFLKKMLPPVPPKTGDDAEKKSATPAQPEAPPEPQYYIQQAGALILITPRPLNLKKLRPAGSKLLTEDSNFRMARNRFNSESIFLFVNIGDIEKEDAEQEKKFEEQRKQAMAAAAEKQEADEKTEEELKKEIENAGVTPVPDASNSEDVNIVGVVKDSKATAEAPPPIYNLLGMVLATTGGVMDGKWPEALGVAVSLEGESFDVRALMVSKPGEKVDPVPFFPLLAVGPPITPEAPSILPADTEMLVSFSVDLPQVYAMFAKPRPAEMVAALAPQPDNREFEQPLAALERQLKINIKDELLPLLGSEVVVSVPLTGLDLIQPPQPPPSSSPSPSPSASPSPNAAVSGVEPAKEPAKTNRSPVVVLSLKDKEGMRALLPRIVESVAFKGANAFAQTERREDTELVSYVNLLAYAFIGNYLVISPDAATTRHVVDSYLKHQTLAGDPHFKNYTRWQPRQLQGQIYISPMLMEGYRKWAQQPNTPLDDQTRAFLTRFSIVAQPVTYSLSNEGFGPQHELHLPKNLVLLMIAAAAGNMNTPAPDPATPATPPKPDSSNPF